MRVVKFYFPTAGILFFLGGFYFMGTVCAQEKSTENAKTAIEKSSKKGADEKSGAVEEKEELVLGEISIDAVIEKPNVDIIPKRKKVKLGRITFIDRSFEKEIKALPRTLFLYDKELDVPKKLGKLNKILKKK